MITTITITAPNGTRKYWVKSDGLGGWIQTTNHFEMEGVAILRYIPIIPEDVLGELFQVGEYLKEYEDFDLTYEYIESKVSKINIDVSKNGGVDFINVNKNTPANGSASFGLLDGDFSVGDSLVIKVLSSEEPDKFATAESEII